MNISLFGLGYVGTVTGACLAKEGHKVIGVDIVEQKVDLINRGQSPVVEAELEDLVRQVVAQKDFRATGDSKEALQNCDLAMVCVGTPSGPTGSLSTQHLEAVLSDMVAHLKIRQSTQQCCIVIRSTVEPGTVEGKLIPLLENKLERPLGGSIDVVFHPEFLREGSSVRDFYDPPKIVIGERVPGVGQRVMELYSDIQAPRFLTSIETAEMVKFADNAFHATKITFANELGQLCHLHGIDAEKVMEIFCSDTKLNLSPRYLKPGFAFGGSCLPKDLRALLSLSAKGVIDLPMLAGILPSNKLQVERVFNLAMNGKPKSVGFAGLSFKPGTDDLRESPLVDLAEKFLSKGVKLSIYDPCLRIQRLIGKNKAYMVEHFSHLADHLMDKLMDLAECDLIIVGHPLEKTDIESLMESGASVFDLTGTRKVEGNLRYQTIF